ncbi:MAG TPA: trypsin-like peptidase domain-containing protein [Thermomicrobiales bacterium]|nr:trypsin-like peptidase domain-containing protein [Thermomicrobiales bacterium]
MTVSINEFSNSLADAVERAGGYTVRVNARGRYGSSGIVWAEGIVLTADHTIERDEEITITLPDGSDLPATIAGRDPRSDLAVLKVEGLTLAAAPRAENGRVGSIALAVGRSGGGENGIGASLGIIASVGALGRGRRRRRGGKASVESVIRPDLTMYPGFSGGPLIDTSGAMIGVNTSGFRGQPLTIPHAAIGEVVEQLLTHGRLRRGYLGMTSQPVRLPEAVATTAGQETGLLAVGVEEDSPASTGGVMIGDILIGVGDEPVRDTDDLRSALGPDMAGQPATLRILRGGELRELTVTIGER